MEQRLLIDDFQKCNHEITLAASSITGGYTKILTMISNPCSFMWFKVTVNGCKPIYDGDNFRTAIASYNSAIQHVEMKKVVKEVEKEETEACPEITPENIVIGLIKWDRIKVLPYYGRASIMISAKAIWQEQQKTLASVLNMPTNSLESFFCTIRRKIKKGELTLFRLQGAGYPKHSSLITRFVNETLEKEVMS